MAGSDALPLTGERTVPGVAHENYWFRRHEAAYAWACDVVRGKRVLEVGCGEGYGTSVLAAHATSISAVDYDARTVAHAARAYRRASFVRGNLAALPARTASVDVLATLQVIEHVWDHAEFLTECRRVLRPQGTLLVTTPNRLTFSPGLDEPANLFHTKEFTAAELTALLQHCGFDVTFTGGLNAGARLRDLDDRYAGSFVDAQLSQDPQTWSERLHADVGAIDVGDFTVLADHESDIDAALDLVVLATSGHRTGTGTAGSAR